MLQALITGAEQGLGLAFAQQYAAEGWDVLAVARHPGEVHDLQQIWPSCTIEALDAGSDNSLRSFVRRVGSRPIDVMILNEDIGPGILGKTAEFSRNGWEHVIGVNTFAPFFLAGALAANVAASGQRKLVAISSIAASIESFDGPGQYYYRASKSALNALWRSLSVDWRDRHIICLCLRPEDVRTRATDSLGNIDLQASVQGMRAVIARATMEQSGSFIGYDGSVVPW
jgi:NAD(P)-dependent dehydrogenase (short-subunit alcohol dehydrogenase family)